MLGLNLCPQITQLVDLAAVMFASEEDRLDGGALLDGYRPNGPHVSGQYIFSVSEGTRFFEVTRKTFIANVQTTNQTVLRM